MPAGVSSPHQNDGSGPPFYIQHNQYPCQCLFLERRVMWSQTIRQRNISQIRVQSGGLAMEFPSEVNNMARRNMNMPAHQNTGKETNKKNKKRGEVMHTCNIIDFRRKRETKQTGTHGAPKSAQCQPATVVDRVGIIRDSLSLTLRWTALLLAGTRWLGIGLRSFLQYNKG